MQKLLRTIAPIAAASAIAACFPDPALLDDDATDTSAGEDTTADAQPEPDGGEDGASGECETAADCTHLAGNCLKVLCLANTCATQPDPGATCDDGDPCTKDDLCDGTTCGGTAYTCDDGVACTADQCDGAGGCTYPVADGFCRIDGACVTAGDTKEDDPCRICEGGQAWSPNDGATCEDGDPICTTGDTCSGTTCIGGPRPSDADTDWILRPVDVVAPATATIRSLGPAGAHDTYMLVEVSDAVKLDDPDATALDGKSVVVMRRSREGNLSTAVVYTGFERAVATTFRRPDAEPWRYVMAVSLEGAGDRTVFGNTSRLDTLNGRVSDIVTFSRLGGVPINFPWREPVDNATSPTDGGTVLTGDFTGTFDPDGITAHTWSGGDPDRPWHRYVAWTDATGEFMTAVFIESKEFLGDADLRAIPGSKDFWLTLSYRRDLRIEPAQGEAFSLSHADDTWRYTVLRLGPEGQLLDTLAPFLFDAQPASANTSFASPTIIGVSESGPIVVVNGRPTGTASSVTTLTGGASGQSILAMTTSWEPLWWVSTVSAGFGVPLTGSTVWMSHDRISAIWQGNAGEAQLLAGDGTYTLEPENVGVLSLTTNGEVLMVRALGTGPLFTTAAFHDGDGALAVGMNTMFADATASGADGDFDLTATADMTAYALGVNTSNGLMCLP